MGDKIGAISDRPKTSAPITLNTAGHLMMWAYHNRNTNYSLKPEQWLKLGVAGVQRFVTMNQIKYEFAVGQQLLKIGAGIRSYKVLVGDIIQLLLEKLKLRLEIKTSYLKGYNKVSGMHNI